MTSTKPDGASGSKKKMSGGRALAEMLNLFGAGPIFGMGGFQLLPLYEAVRDLGLPHCLVNDERSGVFAADAYARVTGKPGVCDATLGPGATNLVTGLVESLNAGIPLIAIVGDAHRLYAGKNMTQESDQCAILRPAVKELIRVEEASRIPELVTRAYVVSTSGRPGPVVLDIPEDVSHGEVDFDPAEFHSDLDVMAIAARAYRPSEEAILRAAALLLRAERPLILAGGGVHLSRGYGQLLAVAETLNVPVAHTISGKGSIPCNHPLSAGLFGRFSRIANDLIEESDCLLVVGSKLGEIATSRYSLIPANVPIIQVDVVPEEIGRTGPVQVPLVGDAGSALGDLLDALSNDASLLRTRWRGYATEIAERMKEWREDAQSRLTSSEIPVSVARIVHQLNRVLPEDGILVADGGFASHWTGLLYETKRAGRSYIANRGFASIGYGLPGALGAQLAAPHSNVVAVTGDAGFNMCLGELETAKRSGAGLTLVVINNAASGYVKALQHQMYQGKYQSTDLIDLDYAGIASAMGCGGISVTDPNDLDAALRAGIADTDGPTVIDVKVTRDPAKMLPGVDRRVETGAVATG